MRQRSCTRAACKRAAIEIVIAALFLIPTDLAAQSTPTVTVTPLTVACGGTITVTVTNGPGNATDWVGLYAAAAPDTAMLDWKYLNGSRSLPPLGVTSATVTFSAPSTAGVYNVRFFTNNTYTLLATSAAITVQNPASPSITVTPTTVTGGGTVAATVSNGPGNARDWVGVYATGAPDTMMLDWKYLNGTRTPPATGVTAATVTFTMPATSGTYNVRFFSNDTMSLLATSATITVQIATPAPTVLTVTPAAVAPGGTETATVANGPGNARDWLGLFPAGAGNLNYLDWKYLNGLQTAPSVGFTSATVKFTMAVPPGSYNVRLFSSDSYTLVATSATFVVDGSAPVVSITVPAAYASVAGTVTVSASASDDVAVAAVQFTVDGMNVGAADLTAPYSLSWDTTTVTDGAHALRAVARDTAGNQTTSAPVSVTVANGSATPPPCCSTITVPAGGDLQAAINNANPGDTILLQAGATFTGNFVLPVKSGASFITIRSSAPDSSLPAAGTRIDPTYAPQLAKLQSPNSAPALATAAGAHHYTLLFLEFLANYQGYGDIVTLGDGSSAQNSLSMVPHDLVVDRCYVHGDVTYGQKRGIALNSASTTVMNSYIAEIKAVGQDSQAVGGWNGPGPFTIRNNYLEAAGENVLFGGADPAIPNLIPSDITLQYNTLAKQVAWRTQSWSVKNIFELKNAQRVVVDGNVLEYNWLSGQAGYAVVFTPRNQDGGCPWCVVQQVQFTNNVVRHVSSGINILGTDNLHPSGTLNALTIRNNLFEDVSGVNWGGSGRFVLIGAGAATVTIDHNTVLQDGSSALYGYGAPMTGFVFTNNIVPDNSWAIMGDNASPGNVAIAMYFPGGVFKDGIFAGSNPAIYPVNNYYPTGMSTVGFVDLTGGNYRLATTSPYRNAATDGTDVGCNIDALDAAARVTY